MHNQQRPPEPHLKTNTIHKDVYITTSGVLFNAPKPSVCREAFIALNTELGDSFTPPPYPRQELTIPALCVPVLYSVPSPRK